MLFISYQIRVTFKHSVDEDQLTTTILYITNQKFRVTISSIESTNF